MKKAILTLVIVALLGGGGYAYYRYRTKKPGPTVATAAITRGDITEQVGATGTLQAVTTVQVGTQVSGTIQQLNADFNSLVHKGQVLARLDPSLFQTQIEQARANLLRSQADVERLRVGVEDARTKVNRARELSGRQLLPKSDLDAAEVEVRSAEAQLRSAEAQVTQAQAALNQNQVNLQHTVIEAPIDGLVISRNVDVGQTVAASMQAPTLFVLAADLTKMQVLANLDESDVGRIRPGQHVTFRVDAYPAEEFAGTVAQVRLQPIVQQNVVTYATVINVPNPDLKLKPGMTANVNVQIARRTDVLRVPNTALRFRPTNDIFAALGQTPPAQGPFGNAGREGAGRGRSGRSGASDGPPAAAPTSGAGPGDTAKPISTTPPAPDVNAAPSAGSGREARAGDRGAAQGGEPGAGRERFMARLNQMSPDERERALQRMRARGVDPTAGASRAADLAVGRAGSRTAADASTRRAAPSPDGARTGGKPQEPTTIDALFGPLPPVESVGRVWVYTSAEPKPAPDAGSTPGSTFVLKPMRVRLGITDGQTTELIAGEGLDEGTELVTSVTTGTETTTRPNTGGLPGLLGPQPGRFGGPGGFGGGNRGGGR